MTRNFKDRDTDVGSVDVDGISVLLFGFSGNSSARHIHQRESAARVATRL